MAAAEAAARADNGNAGSNLVNGSTSETEEGFRKLQGRRLKRGEVGVERREVRVGGSFENSSFVLN